MGIFISPDGHIYQSRWAYLFITLTMLTHSIDIDSYQSSQNNSQNILKNGKFYLSEFV